MTVFWALLALAFVALFVWVEIRRSGKFWGIDNPHRRNPSKWHSHTKSGDGEE